MSGAQSMKALELANRIRLGRAELKRQVKAGTLPVTTLIDETPKAVESMTVGKLLAAQDRWGVRRTQKFLGPLEIHENRPLSALTERQRGLLIGALEAKQR